MPTSHNPGPDDHNALSSWERQVLADIEHDLTASDPDLADEMSRPPVRIGRWWPLSGTSTSLLVLSMIVLVLVGALLPASAWAVLGVFTTLIVVPWLLLAATDKRHPKS